MHPGRRAVKAAAKIKAELKALSVPPHADDKTRFSEFAQSVLSDLQERDAKGLPQGTKGAKKHLSDDQVRRIIVTMLRDCSALKVAPPIELVQLVTYRLFHHAEPTKVRNFLAAKPTLAERPEFIAAYNYELDHPGASARALAKAAGVDHKTILTWQRSDSWKRIFPVGN